MNGSPPAVWVTRPREQAQRLEALLQYMATLRRIGAGES